jgi:hypothetical protein
VKTETENMGGIQKQKGNSMRNKPIKHATIKHATILALAGLCGVLFLQTSSRADSVLPGYDLFTTDPSTSFDGLNWAGVPLGTYNFGGSIGAQWVGATDTIMQRLGTWNSTTPGSPVSLQMDALQLVSTTPMFGPGVYGYITLDPAHPSGGTLTINSDGTYSSSITVNFDVHEGSLTGTIYPPLQDTSLTLTGQGNWQHDPTPNALTIPGVNYLLNGTPPTYLDGTTADDLWPYLVVNGVAVYDPIMESEGSITDESHLFHSTVPETGQTIFLMLVPMALYGVSQLRGRLVRGGKAD